MNIITLVSPFVDTPEILIFGVILGAFLMTASRIWKVALYDICAVGVWLYMAIELSEEPAIVIVMIGLMFCELYRAFYIMKGGC